MPTALTQTVNQDAIMESVLEMLREWLVGANAFASGDSATADIVIDPGKRKRQLIHPEIFIEVTSARPQSLGAGLGGTNKGKHPMTARLSIRTDSSIENPMLQLNRTGDKLWSLWKSRDYGKPVLGMSGLRRALITGPYSTHTDESYTWDYFLSFEVTI